MNLEKAKPIGYWAATGVLALQFAMSGVMSLGRPAPVLAGMEHLGYPSYFALVLGGWKVLGVLALLAPRVPRLKEWAYAGIFFDLTGAAFSHAASGDGPGQVAAPLMFAVVAWASWALRPQERTLGALPTLPRVTVDAQEGFAA